MDIKKIPFEDNDTLSIDDIINRNQSISSLNDVNNFLTDCINVLNLNFHPDDPFEDYINLETKEPTFTKEQAEKLNTINDNCFKECERLGVDYYGLGFDITNHKMGGIFGSDIKEGFNIFNNNNDTSKPNRIISADRDKGEFKWINYQKDLGDHTISITKQEINKKELLEHYREDYFLVKSNDTNKAPKELEGKVIEYPAKDLPIILIPKSEIKKIYFPKNRVDYYINMFGRLNNKYNNNSFFQSILNTLKTKQELTLNQLSELRFLLQNGKSKYEAKILPNNY